MKRLRDRTLTLLLNARDGNRVEEIEEFFGESYVEELFAVKNARDSLEKLLDPTRQIKEYVHVSWLDGAVKSLSAPLQPHATAALGKKIGKRIAAKLGIKTAPQPSKLGGRWLRQLLRRRFLDRHPEEKSLPSTELSRLLDLSSEQLRQMIGLLGVVDLSPYMRTIVDKRRLQAIKQWLSEDEERYLTYCAAQRDKLRLPPIDLSSWKGDRQTLRQALSRRGVIRLGKALSGQPTALIEQLQHRLERSWAEIMNNHIEKTQDEMALFAAQRVLLLLSSMLKESR